MWLRLMRRYPVGILNERLMRYRHGRWQWSQRWRRLRTETDLELDVMEIYLQEDGWRERLRPADLVEYSFPQKLSTLFLPSGRVPQFRIESSGSP